MAKGDVQFRQARQFGVPGARRHRVGGGAAASINAGEPVSKTLGNLYVIAAVTNTPTTATSPLLGIAATTSTDTTTAAGFVDVVECQQGVVYLASPLLPTSWDTQTEYNNLVGARVLFDLTSSSYTITATDGSTNGLQVEYLDIAEVPGKVAFSVRPTAMWSN